MKITKCTFISFSTNIRIEVAIKFEGSKNKEKIWYFYFRFDLFLKVLVHNVNRTSV